MHKTPLMIAALMALSSCGSGATSTDDIASRSRVDSAGMATVSAASGAAFISADSANVMLESYLNSIGGPDNDTNLKSVILDADALRAYLMEDEGERITTLKVMFAHTPAYIHAGGKDRNCGYRSDALTVVVAGIDDDGNYVMFGGDQVLNHAIPCPASCPSAGTAAGDLLPQ